MNFSLSALAASFVFGVFGISLFRLAKKRGNTGVMAIGVALLVYPYFVENAIWTWGIGMVLVVLGYRMALS